MRRRNANRRPREEGQWVLLLFMKVHRRVIWLVRLNLLIGRVGKPSFRVLLCLMNCGSSVIDRPTCGVIMNRGSGQSKSTVNRTWGSVGRVRSVPRLLTLTLPRRTRRLTFSGGGVVSQSGLLIWRPKRPVLTVTVFILLLRLLPVIVLYWVFCCRTLILRSKLLRTCIFMKTWFGLLRKPPSPRLLALILSVLLTLISSERTGPQQKLLKLGSRPFRLTRFMNRGQTCDCFLIFFY